MEGDDWPSNWTLEAEATAPYRVVSFVVACCMIVTCVLGVAGNTLSLFVFTRPALRSVSINVLLAALSLADLGLLLLASPVFALAPLASVAVQPTAVWSGELVVSMILYVYPVAVMFQCASVWLLVAVTVERWIAVCHPFLVATFCTRRRTLITVFLIVVCSVVYNLVRFWEYRRHPLDSTNVSPLLRARSDFMLWYVTVSATLSQLLLPLTVLCVFNLHVARTIIHANERRQSLSPRDAREHATAKMMLSVVLVFVCCYLFSFVLNVVEMAEPELFAAAAGHCLNDVNNALVLVNSASSALFYWHFSTRFRREARKLRSQCFGARSFYTDTRTSQMLTLADGPRAAPPAVRRCISVAVDGLPAASASSCRILYHRVSADETHVMRYSNSMFFNNFTPPNTSRL